ncbi:RluA family pseudouridine synthase [bacterium]|nr:RluA family pseudouridine synthase [bacterium]
MRLDAALAVYADISRSQVQKWISAGLVFVDGKPGEAAQKLKNGQKVSFRRPPLQPALPEADGSIKIDAVYEDKHILVLNKPRGLVVHPGAGVRGGTLVNALLAHCRDLSGIGGVERPGIVHRLDKDTSGLMVVAKDDRSHVNLCEQFASRQVVKHYEALTFGVPKPAQGIIEQPIGRSPRDRKCMAVCSGGRYAKTEYKTTETFGREYAYLRIHIFTGRTHQIRVHLSWLGCPLVGDLLYKTRPNEWGLQGQALHCGFLSFSHPISGERLSFSAQPPKEIADILEELRSSFF